jgi:hypothetical protein
MFICKAASETSTEDVAFVLSPFILICIILSVPSALREAILLW